MTRREARRIALEECAALIQQQIDAPWGFIEGDSDDHDKITREAEAIRDRLRDQAERLRP